jgi:carbamoylphosphate synthase small subunit
MKKSKYNIFMVGYSPSYACWFPLPYEIVTDPRKADIAWWIGGADIDCKAITGEKVGSHTYIDPRSSKEEIAGWEYFKDKNVFKVGTCKGHQNLACFSGAKIIQHSRHPHIHPIITKEGKEIECVSLHHQQILVDEKYTGLKENKDYELIGWTEKLSPFHLNGEDEDYSFPLDYKEPEIIWFPKTKSFGVQSHPEMMGGSTQFVKYCQKNLLEKLKECNF